MTHMREEDDDMNQLTVRGFDKDLQRCLREFARRQGVSLNRAAVTLMRR